MADVETGQESTPPATNNPLSKFFQEATFLNKSFTLYMAALSAAVIAVLKLLDESKLKESFGGWGIFIFCGLIFVPFLLIFLTDTLPKILEKRREKSLQLLGMQGQVQQAGYFRLEPYQERDQDKFFRADNAQEKVLQWILSATSPLLYLSGRSGTGKSSLLASWVLPKLQQQNYKVLSLRAYHDPLIALQQQLCAKGVIWQNGREANEAVADLLRKACDKLQNQTLLLVFDQFEELTIIQDEQTRQQFVTFLQNLLVQPPKNLKILTVFRFDYYVKIGNLELSKITLNENIQFIEPFDDAAARDFFHKSGLNLSPALLDKVLAEAKKLEEDKSMLRPITLNMLGVVLQRFGGGSLQGTEPGKLIRNYLHEAVTESEVREFAPLLLRQMVSDAGTKIALSESELNQKTQINEIAVRGCLVRLGSRGLVREVDAKLRVWEVSHDFIARLLGQLVAGLLPSWWKRSSKIFAYSGLMIWLMAILMGYPAYQEYSYYKNLTRQDYEYNNNRSLVVNFGIKYIPKEHGKLEVQISYLEVEKISDEIWQALLHDKDKIVSLFIFSNKNLSQLPSLDNLTSLQSLAIGMNPSLDHLPDLSHLSALETLSIVANNNLTQLPTLNSLTDLKALRISHNESLTQLPALNSLTDLKALEISSNKNLTQLPTLNSLTALQDLDIFFNKNLNQLPDLSSLTALQRLFIAKNDNLTQLPDLNSLTALKILEIRYNENLIQLPTIGKLSELMFVSIGQSKGLNDLQLHKLAGLKKLFLSDDEIGKTFAETFKQLRQQQGLNAVEIEFRHGYIHWEEELDKLKFVLEEELKKLKQP